MGRRAVLGPSICAAFLIGGGIAAAAPARADVVQGVHLEADPGGRGQAGTLLTRLTLRETRDGVMPAKLEAAVLRLPAGARIDRRAATMCRRKVLAAGPCPRSSRVGRGSVALQVAGQEASGGPLTAYHARLDPDDRKIPIVRKTKGRPLARVYVLLEDGETGVREILDGVLVHRPRGGFSYAIVFDHLPSLTSAGGAIIRASRLTLRLGGKRTVRKRVLHYYRNPKGCPHGGAWVGAMDTVLAGGGGATLRSSASIPCR